MRHAGREGQSLIEVLVATGVGAIMIISAITVIAPALRSNTDVIRVQIGAALGRELLDNVRVFSEADWHNLSRLGNTSANKYFLATGSGIFRAVMGTEGVVVGAPSGTVAHWKMDESSGTVVNDAVGTNHGIASGGAAATTTLGKVGGAFEFPGPGYPAVTVPDDNALDFGTGSFSISMWGYFRDHTYPKAWFMIKKSGVCYQAGNPGWDIGHGYNANGISICYSDGTNGVSNASVAFNVGSRPMDNLNKWTHFLAVFDKTAGRVRFYVNGVRQANEYTISGVTGAVNNSSNLEIGTMYGWKTDGLLDDIRLYGRALGDGEATELYEAQIFKRYFYVDTVKRDSGFNITTGAGTIDPSTLQVTVAYGWEQGNTTTISTFLTRFSNRATSQTSWRDGPNDVGIVTTSTNRFGTSTNLKYASSTGSIEVSL